MRAHLASVDWASVNWSTGKLGQSGNWAVGRGGESPRGGGGVACGERRERGVKASLVPAHQEEDGCRLERDERRLYVLRDRIPMGEGVDVTGGVRGELEPPRAEGESFGAARPDRPDRDGCVQKEASGADEIAQAGRKQARV